MDDANEHAAVCTAVFSGHKNAVTTLQPFRKKVYSGSLDQTVRVWDVHTEKCVQEVHVGSPVYSGLVIGEVLYLGCMKQIIMVDLQSSFAVIDKVDAHLSEVRSLQTDGAGKLFSGSRDRTVAVWDTQMMAQKEAKLAGHKGSINGICVVGDHIFTGSLDRQIHVWERASYTRVSVMKGHAAGIRSLDNLGSVLYSAGDDLNVRSWDVHDLQEKEHKALGGHTKGVNVVQVGFGGTVFTGSQDHTIKVWDALTNDAITTIEGHTDEVTSMHVADRHGVLYSGGGAKDGTVRLWNIKGPILQFLLRKVMWEREHHDQPWLQQ